MKKILLLANDVTTILQFRCELVSALVADGNDVTVCVPESPRISEIEALGARVTTVAVARHGTNPVQDIKLYFAYRRLVKSLRPDVVLTFTIKPNVYGGMACGGLRIPYIANVTGLGEAEKSGILQKIMLTLYRVGVRKARCVFFQNKSNREFFESKRVTRGNTRLLPGSGVNITKFSYREYPDESEDINIVFVGRIIRDKGVFELAEAARSLASASNLKFTVVGDVEYGAENPFTGLPNVSCVGYHKDVRPFVSAAHAVILPSYHEGMANVLLEAAATGRPILASQIPGCQETFDEGISGFGFMPKDGKSTEEAIAKFISLSHGERKKMGEAGRLKMEREFDRNIVIKMYFEEIGR